MQRFLKGSDKNRVPDGGAVGNYKKVTKGGHSFHCRYMELCRSRGLKPIADLVSKNNGTAQLGLYGDKMNVDDWLLVIDALQYDQLLQMISMRMHKTHGTLLEQLDTEKKAKLLHRKPVIYTKFVFARLMKAVAHSLEFNTNLKVLKLEGMPQTDKYVKCIAMALATNDTLCELSFHRSFIGDAGCEIICNAVKYMTHIEKVDLSFCALTDFGAECVADMIEVQRIRRYTEVWEQSPRYRDIDVNAIPGLHTVNIAGNTQIGDLGAKHIAAILKEDNCIKVIDMENCGLTDLGAMHIYKCLKHNKTITHFCVCHNQKISNNLQHKIHDTLGNTNEIDTDKLGKFGTDFCHQTKTLAQSFDEIFFLQNKVFSARTFRKIAEMLYEKVKQLIIYNDENTVEKAIIRLNVPYNFNMPKNPIFSCKIELQPFINAACISGIPLPRNALSTLRPRVITFTGDDNMITIELAPLLHQVQRIHYVMSEFGYIESIQSKERIKKYISEWAYEFGSKSKLQKKQLLFETNVVIDVIEHVTAAAESGNNDNNKPSNEAIDLEKGGGEEVEIQELHGQNNTNSNNENYTKITNIDDISLVNDSAANLDLYDSDITPCNSNVSLNSIAQEMIDTVDMGQGTDELILEVIPSHVIM